MEFKETALQARWVYLYHVCLFQKTEVQEPTNQPVIVDVQSLHHYQLKCFSWGV